MSNDRLDSWTKGSNPCDWDGVACSNNVLPRGRDQGDAALVVSNISLAGFAPVGMLDRLHFSDLPHLVYLDLSGNILQGSIPSNIGALAQLTHLDLCCSILRGSIPSSIGALSQLTHLDLSNNELNGSIPTSLDLPHLVYLNLGNNHLSGGIPSSIGALAELTYLDLSINDQNGSIPPFIGNCTKLSSLDLSYYNLFLPWLVK
ncbi:receptor-like protein 53 [Triticum aestivum]|uniref:receptor-like protein 53 n=1 Tax=Triticum aestivum TaxID=4565 RepID=UPI001D016253|nr:receptor-like protein 53 [Triticum aestivum]